MAAVQLKTPKGTRDWDGRDMAIREGIFKTITEVFKRHGAVTIDTPVFELKEILSGNYGEDSKLIYDLADQGGELCSLRVSLQRSLNAVSEHLLAVRFSAAGALNVYAVYLAMNSSIQHIKRYAIAKVYRRDQPAMTKGRMREFYQCDYDCAGVFDEMVPDSEIFRIIVEVFEGLGWKGNYVIKTNHRKILDGIFSVCGVPSEKTRTISSAVDKLDKSPWDAVRHEMVVDKGLSEEIADKIHTYVTLKGGKELLSRLSSDTALMSNADAAKGVKDMQLLFEYLETFDVLDKVSLDMSLARGLDYYTGVIYEVVTEGSAPPTAGSQEAQRLQQASKNKKKSASKDADEDRSNDPSVGVGSVAAGGRYDNLVGRFSGRQLPCVGISFGVDRIFSIIKARMAKDQAQAVRLNEVEVFVMAFGGKGFDGLLKQRMQIAKMLWDAGIKAEFSWKVKPKLPQQFKQAETGGVPLAVILGEDELAQGKVNIKEMGLPEGHPEKNGVLVSKDDLVTEVRRRLAAKTGSEESNGVSSLGEQVKQTKLQDRDDVPAEPPAIPTTS